MADPLIVIPDDFPSVFEGSAAHQRAAKLGDLRVFSQRGADDQDELIRRLGRARIAINIRAHARFTDFGHSFGMTAAGTIPSRVGPRHWVHSCVAAGLTPRARNNRMSKYRMAGG